MSSRYVAFSVGSVRYCLPIAEVQQIVRHEGVTAVPQSPAFVEGVINLRGEVVPVVGMRERLGVFGEGEARKSRVIVVELGGRLYGLHVDDVREIVEVELDAPAEGAEAAGGARAGGGSAGQFARGIARAGEEPLVVLNLQQVLAGTSPRG